MRLESRLAEDVSTTFGVMMIPHCLCKVKNLMKLLDIMKKEIEKSYFYLNLKNIKILSTEKIDVFRLGDEDVEIVETFIFLVIRSK